MDRNFGVEGLGIFLRKDIFKQLCVCDLVTGETPEIYLCDGQRRTEADRRGTSTSPD